MVISLLFLTKISPTQRNFYMFWYNSGYSKRRSMPLPFNTTTIGFI